MRKNFNPEHAQESIFVLHDCFSVCVQGIQFYTQVKTVTQMWRGEDAQLSTGSATAMPVMR